MKIVYDPETDILRVTFSNAAIDESDEDKPGVILDYDRDGNIVGLEILDASKRMEDPRSLEYAVAGQNQTRSPSVPSKPTAQGNCFPLALRFGRGEERCRSVCHA